MATTTGSSGVTTQGNRTYFFGTSSGVNTSALVEAAYNQKIAPAVTIDTQISKNGKKIDGYNTLNTLTSAVQTSLANLKANFGFTNINNNYVFNARSGSMSTNNSTDPTKLLGVSIDPGTTLGSYELEVMQKAKAHRIGSDATANPATALGATGSFNIGLAGGTTAAVNVTSGMSMNDLATAINSSTSTTGVTASVIKTSATSYQLVLTANTTAKAISITGITGTNVLQNIGVLNGSNAVKNQLQAADQAILKLDGVTITRDTNDISDLIPGIHLNVLNAEPGTLIDLAIDNDTSQLKSEIVNFIESYNELRDFIIKNQTVSPTGSISEDAILFADNILKTITSSLQSLIGQSYNNGSNSLATLRELGITLDNNNKFVVNEGTLDSAILNNYADVRSIFTTQVTSNNANFALLGNTSKQKNMSFAMSISANASGVTAVSIGGNSNLFNINGNSIVGRAGTIYEGLSFAFVGNSSTLVNFSMNQGLANLVTNNLSSITDVNTGTIAAQKTTLTQQNTTMQTRADDIRSRAEEFRTNLIDRYARYEAQIARNKSVIAQLKAILGIKDDN